MANKVVDLVVFWSVVFYLFNGAALANGAYADGDGSPEFPYEIAEPNQLIYMSQHPEHWGLNFILTADINLALADPNTFTTALIAPDTSSSGGFQGTPFTGVFDGNGHTISNLTIDTTGAGNDYLGLFGKIEDPNAKIKDLGLENVTLTGGDHSEYLGGLCGSIEGEIITNCYATGAVTGGEYYRSLGGLCGLNDNGSISNCYANVSVNGGINSWNLGGLCGDNRGDISNCYATGFVTGGDDSWYLGGLCGWNYGDISNCYAIGSVTGGDYSLYLGGLCGWTEYGSINHCYATGAVTGDAYLGGLCGSSSFGGDISNCYATGLVSGGDNSKSLGGLCGWNLGSISNCFATGAVNGGDNSNAIGGLCGMNEGDISNCYATGSVSGGANSWYLGGLCGNNSGSTFFGYGVISNCYATGSITGGDNSDSLGGLCGRNYKGIISICYSCGSVTAGAGSEDLGGLCGNNYDGTISYCFFLDTAGPHNVLGTPLTDSQMKQQSSFVGWDFVGEEDNGTENHWQLCLDGYDYPRLAWQFINPADFLHPGRVDLYDLFTLTHDWLTENSRCCDIAPVNNPDDIVNHFDYAEFTKYWLNE